VCHTGGGKSKPYALGGSKTAQQLRYQDLKSCGLTRNCEQSGV
jgi:hypothetical protein